MTDVDRIDGYTNALFEGAKAEGTLDEAVRRAVFATRQLAKRQLTWLRGEPGLEWLDPTVPGWLARGLEWARCATMPVR